VEWYRQQPNSWQSLKVFAPYALEVKARAHRYELGVWRAFRYRGTSGVPMLHFAMEWKYSAHSTIPDAGNLNDLLCAGLWIVTDAIYSDPSSPPRPGRIETGRGSPPTDPGIS
jgi:hypothetical protein